MTTQSRTPRSLGDIEPTPEMREGAELIKLDFSGGETVYLCWQEQGWTVHPDFVPASIGYLSVQVGSSVVLTEGRVVINEPVIFCFSGKSYSVVSAACLRRMTTCHCSDAHRGTLTLHKS